MNSWELVAPVLILDPLYLPTVRLHISFSQIASLLSIEHLLFTLVLRSFRCFFFPLSYFHRYQILTGLRSVLTCLVFGISRNILPPSFLVNVHQIWFFYLVVLFLYGNSEIFKNYASNAPLLSSSCSASFLFIKFYGIFLKGVGVSC